MGFNSAFKGLSTENSLKKEKKIELGVSSIL